MTLFELHEKGGERGMWLGREAFRTCTKREGRAVPNLGKEPFVPCLRIGVIVHLLTTYYLLLTTYYLLLSYLA